MTAEELTAARQALGLKRIELARLFHTTDRTVRAWENGEGADTKWREIPFAVAMLIKLAVKSAMVRRELGIGRPKPAGPVFAPDPQNPQRMPHDETAGPESEQTPTG